jgi:hypothetical protein
VNLGRVLGTRARKLSLGYLEIESEMRRVKTKTPPGCPRRPLREGKLSVSAQTPDAGMAPPGAHMAMVIRELGKKLMIKVSYFIIEA